MDYSTGLQRALDYIEAHLTEQELPEAAARAAHLSPFYFGRIFGILCGYSPAEYIRYRRLTLAGSELAAGAKVLETALKYGYDSPESFARAFARFHGFPPSQARKEGAHLKSFSRLTVQLSLKGGMTMDYQLVHKPAFCVLQKAEPQSTVAEQNLRSIPDFWGRAAKDDTFPILFSHMTEPQALLGICWAKAPQSTDFSYGIGAVCAPDCVAPAGFSLRSIPARTWAVFPCRGAMPDAIQQLWQRIGSEFFPTSGYRPTGELDIEVYPEGDMHAPDYASEIWVPVEKV